MDIAFTFPTWLLWTLGFAAGVVVLSLAMLGVVLGVMFLKFMKDFHIPF